MTEPLCPHCRERMSSVEQGLGGVWSCLYCEGTWLTAAQMRAVVSTPNAAPPHRLRTSPAIHDEALRESLVCPGCDDSSLQAVSLGAVQAHYCLRCQGAFFGKGVVAAHAPQLISRSGEAPMVSTLLGVVGTVAMLGDAIPLIAAMAWQSQADRDR